MGLKSVESFSPHNSLSCPTDQEQAAPYTASPRTRRLSWSYLAYRTGADPPDQIDLFDFETLLLELRSHTESVLKKENSSDFSIDIHGYACLHCPANQRAGLAKG